LENDLKGALERREFVLFYQPIVSLHDGVLDGFKALIRWKHPQRGVIGPDEFIPLAEESGAVLPIGAWSSKKPAGKRQAGETSSAGANA